MLWMDRRPLDPIPESKDDAEGDGKEDRGIEVGHADDDVQHVGRHRSKHRDHRHRKPIGPRVVALRAKLKRERACKSETADRDGDDRIDDLHEIIGSAFPHGGREHFHDPEQDRDGGDLPGEVTAVAKIG